MFATMIFAIAIVALFQFALFYWRSVLTGVAAQPVSSRVLEAAHVEQVNITAADFDRLVSLHALTPELHNVKDGLGLVGAYYKLARTVETLFGQISPAIANWSEREMTLCAQYAVVQIDRRLQSNLAEAASMRSC